MKMPQQFSLRQALTDSAIGLVVALVSIPISMGYALVAGLPVVHGLYGSLLPILVFGLISTSPRFVFGVDAAPAVLAGGMLSAMGIAAESREALQIIPCAALWVSAWLFLFFLVRADRILRFISQPVMGGFISGIGITIISMQIPKLFGGVSGSGEFLELFLHILGQGRRGLHLPSLLLGLFTIAVILFCRKKIPRFPIQPVLMFSGALTVYACRRAFPGSAAGAFFDIQTLPPVEPGLPPFAFPLGKETLGLWRDFLLPSLSMALVILSETLLASSNVALKHDERLQTRREVLAYAAGNLAAAVSGSCPVNGSVSRTGIANQYGVQSQWMSLSAALAMLLVLLFCTDFIAYLPVPVLTGIVIAALSSTLEFSLARRLRAVDKSECMIFYGAFASVLIFGTVYGVILGVLLSAFTFIWRQARPATDFLGLVPGLDGFYSLTRRGTAARPIRGAVIYRFSGPLFYANIDLFCQDILAAVKSETRALLVDSSGITSIDAPAAERLLQLRKKLLAQKIRFYLAGHVSAVNDQLRAFGGEALVYEKAVRSSLPLALAAAGFTPPYPAEEKEAGNAAFYSEQLAEFDWAFGSDSERLKADITRRLADRILAEGDFDADEVRRQAQSLTRGWWNDAVEEEFLDMLELHILSLHERDAAGKGRSAAVIEEKINACHARLEEKLVARNRDVMKELVQRRQKRALQLKEKQPGLYERLQFLNERYFEEIAMEQPQLARRLADIITEAEEERSGDRLGIGAPAKQ